MFVSAFVIHCPNKLLPLCGPNLDSIESYFTDKISSRELIVAESDFTLQLQGSAHSSLYRGRGQTGRKLNVKQTLFRLEDNAILIALTFGP